MHVLPHRKHHDNSCSLLSNSHLQQYACFNLTLASTSHLIATKSDDKTLTTTPNLNKLDTEDTGGYHVLSHQ